MGEPFHHTVILQRLGTYLPHRGMDVYYSPESFSNTEAWVSLPLIFAEVQNDSIEHPDFSDVINGTLPEKYRVVGRVSWADIPQGGQPRLEGQLEIKDASVEQIARDGLLGLSTGFSAQTIADGDTTRIVGAVNPNHVLLFQMAACPNCFPNDNGAMFLNTQQENTTMTEDTETRSLLLQIRDKLFGNTAEAEPVIEPVEEPEPKAEEPTAGPDLEAENAELKNTIDALTAELEAFKAEAAQREKDAAWENIKNTLPEGWLGAKETETRTEFENNKDVFYGKLMAHKAEFTNAKAEGATSCGCDAAAEAQLKNTVKELRKQTNYTIIQE